MGHYRVKNLATARALNFFRKFLLGQEYFTVWRNFTNFSQKFYVLLFTIILVNFPLIFQLNLRVLHTLRVFVFWMPLISSTFDIQFDDWKKVLLHHDFFVDYIHQKKVFPRLERRCQCAVPAHTVTKTALDNS